MDAFIAACKWRRAAENFEKGSDDDEFFSSTPACARRILHTSAPPLVLVRFIEVSKRTSSSGKLLQNGNVIAAAGKEKERGKKK